MLTIADPAHAAPLAEALLAGGVTVLEVALRTPAALEAIAEIVRTCPAATVGAGTIRDADQLAAAIGAGAAFGVSPGTTARLAAAVAESDLAFLPGAATASEEMALANVACVGGSWIAPAGRVAAADWAGITDLARAANEELTRLRPD